LALKLIGIRELARHLDLSIGTISRALNDRSDVNPATRRRVLEAAATLGYSPNQSGRSLRRGRTDLVAMMVPSGPGDTPINTVFLSVLGGLRRRLAEHRLDLAVFVEGGRDDRLIALRRLTERRIADALIIADTESTDPRIDYLLRLRTPFVAFGRTHGHMRHAWVDPDFGKAVEGAVEHFVALGHRRIALILPDRPTYYVTLIEEGYRRAMRAWALATDEGWVLRRPTSEHGGLEAADVLLSFTLAPTAVVLADSMHAAALYRRLNERGLQSGRDLSILALLPEARAEFLTPTLSTFQTDWTGIGTRLADAALVEIAAVEKDHAKAPAPPGLANARIQWLAPVELHRGESVSANV
jgi:DNA-binding LacI/PurR family transcriptional regulator